MLDTHVLLWVADNRLAAASCEMIGQADVVRLSAASVWEIEIKRALGKLSAPQDIAQLAVQAGYEPLAISFEHAVEAARLPPHHGDPFDRMLVAQARLEGLTLATADARMTPYGVAVLEVARA
ncbi:MAG: type II toxin-antitoxin system VapC family toxin [Trebonia sp.]